MKSLVQHIHESLGQVEYFGASTSDEKSAALAADRHANMPSSFQWKNSKGLISTLKRYFLTSDVINSLSTSRVTISPGSSQYITFKSKNGFNQIDVANILKKHLQRFAKIYSVKIHLRDFTSTSFAIYIVNSYGKFTDDYGKIIPDDKLDKNFVIK